MGYPMNEQNQLLINFNLKKDYDEQDFYVSPSNKYAFNIINGWPKWLKSTVNLYGEQYSGKSHLSKIFETKLNYCFPPSVFSVVFCDFEPAGSPP